MSRANGIKDMLQKQIPTMSSEEINSIAHNLAIEEEKHKKKFKKTFRNDEIVRKARNRHANTTKKLANAKTLKKERNRALVDKKRKELEEMYGKMIDAGIISMPGVPKKMNGSYKKNSTYYISRRSIYPAELASEEMRRLIKNDPAAYEYAIDFLFSGMEANHLHLMAKRGEIGIGPSEMYLPLGTDRTKALNFLAKEGSESGLESGGGAGSNSLLPIPKQKNTRNMFNNSFEVENIMIQKPSASAPALASVPNLAPTNWANNDEFSMPIIATKSKGGAKYKTRRNTRN